MQYTIKSLRESLLKNVNEVYEVFKNYFGEDKTDLQNIFTENDVARALNLFDIMSLFGIQDNEDGSFELSEDVLGEINTHFSTYKPSILVWWPKVTVTNENDRSIDIFDLYAKIEITLEGRIPYENNGFQLTKSTFTTSQYAAGYIHSHVPHYSQRDHLTFRNCCLGRGPIVGTINTLKTECNEITWMLFCRELSMYVTVESLSGVPYIKMESIYKGERSTIYSNEYREVDNNMLMCLNPETKAALKEFLIYYLNNGNMTIDFINGSYTIGMECYDYLLDISNAFIKWLNERNDRELVAYLFNNNLLRYVRISDKQFFTTNQMTQSQIDNASHTRVLTFKDQQVNLKIIPDGVEAEASILMDYSLALQIMYKILNVINYRYDNNRNTERRSQEVSSNTRQAVCYI